MKNTLFIITTAIIFAICVSDVSSNQNYGIRNPAIEYTTIPPSSYDNSTYQNPNATATNGNSIVTGNVRYGASFQGEVPYRSTSSFSSGNLGTSTLNSFMRDSTGSEDFSRYQNTNTSVVGSYQPYQLQSEAVATMSHVRTGTTNELNTRISETQRISSLQTSANQQMVTNPNNSIQSPASRQIYYPGTSSIQNQYNNSSELRRIYPRMQQNEQTSATQNRYMQNETYRAEQYQYTDQPQSRINETQSFSNNEIDGALQARINSELLRYNPGYTPDRIGTSLRKESLGQQYAAATQQPYNESYTRGGTGESREQTTFVNPRGYEIAATSEFYLPNQDEGSPARYSPQETTNDIQYQSGSIISPITQRLQQRQYNPAPVAVHGNQPSTENMNLKSVNSDVLRQIKSQLNDLTQSIDARLQSEQYDAVKTGQTHYSSLVSRDSSSEYQATSTKGWLAPSNENESYPDSKSYTQAKFDEYYLAGERHLKAGRYYEAADSFGIAAIYKPNSSLCFAGQGHALFAAGQYISSALFIIRAIELEPEHIQTDTDLAQIAGGKTQLENKIAELQQLIYNNPAAGLRFLLGYVYFKTNRIVEAKQITDSLYQEMSKSTAALSLKIAVDLKLKNQ